MSRVEISCFLCTLSHASYETWMETPKLGLEVEGQDTRGGAAIQHSSQIHTSQLTKMQQSCSKLQHHHHHNIISSTECIITNLAPRHEAIHRSMMFLQYVSRDVKKTLSIFSMFLQYDLSRYGNKLFTILSMFLHYVSRDERYFSSFQCFIHPNLRVETHT